MNLTEVLLALAVVVVVVYVGVKALANLNSLPLPPGPKGYPIIGNILDLPAESKWLKFTEWSKTYGDVVHLSVLGQHIIILNTEKTASDLLDKRGAIYSHRPRLVMAGDLVGHDQGLGLVQYGGRLREMRKYALGGIGGRHADQYFPLQEQEVLRYLAKLRKTPEAFIKHSRWMVGSVILSITYGYRAEEFNDPYIDRAERVMAEFAFLSKTGHWLVDFVPILRFIPEWFPGASFQKIAKKCKANLYEFVSAPYLMVKSQMSKGTARASFVNNILDQNDDKENLDEDYVMWAAAGLYGGATDTTSSLLTTFYLAMCLHPEALQKAQAEIDSAVGKENRLPLFSDRPQMPYVDALFLELIRWGTIIPLGLPHCLIQEDNYNGYRIPKGALVIPNVWGMCRDPETYPSPEKFTPERFLGQNPQKDPRPLVFGSGRRACPGSWLAENTAFITIASTLAIFNISPKDGKLPKKVFGDGTIVHPKPFECTITPRTPLIDHLIQA